MRDKHLALILWNNAFIICLGTSWQFDSFQWIHCITSTTAIVIFFWVTKIISTYIIFRRINYMYKRITKNRGPILLGLDIVPGPYKFNL